jgi:tripartite-type tricarboxylate transporter receptor subunit TctC
LAALAALLVACSASTAATAADTIKIIVPFAAGGPVDAAARVLAAAMQRPLGANIVVENRSGAGGVIGADMVARATPDGKTLLVASQGSLIVSGVLQPHVSYDAAKSFEPIGMMGSVPLMLIANPDLPAKTFKELLALAKKKELTYASAGAGSMMNIAGELMNAETGVSITHIPYRGAAPALNDLIGGQVDLIPADPPVLLPFVQNNSARSLVLFGAKRLSSLPDVPTTVELGYPDLIVENWYGLLAPAGTPADVCDKLEKSFIDAMKSSIVQQHMKAGELSGTLTRQEFKTRIERELAFWRPTIKKLGITVQGNKR